MTSTPTASNRLEQQGLGENLNTWGVDRLNQMLRMVDASLDGVVTLALTGGTVNLTVANYSTDQARQRVLLLTGTLASDLILQPPAGATKWYIVINNLTQDGYAASFGPVGGTVVTIKPGPQILWTDGTNGYAADPTLDKVRKAVAAVDFNGQRGTNGADPLAAQDFATRAYVDDAAFASLSASFPGQFGSTGYVLTTNGTNPAWADPGALDWCSVSGTANVLTLTPPYPLPTLRQGTKLRFLAAADNTGAMTINGTALRSASGQALTGKEVRANRLYTVTYDGAVWRLPISVAGKTVADPGTGLLEVAAPFVGSGGDTAISGTSRTFLATDRGKVVSRKNAGSGMTDTLPGSTIGYLDANWYAYVYNADATAPLALGADTGTTINGAASLAVAPGCGVMVFMDGVNYVALGNSGYGVTMPAGDNGLRLATTAFTQGAALAAAQSAVPAGTVAYFAGTTPPAGWLVRDGSAIAVASYPSLTTAIYCGDANNATAEWGYRCTDSSNPSTSRSTTGAYIVLPDDRGRHDRGWDNGAGRDAGRSFWSYQAGGNASHTHGISESPHTHALTQSPHAHGVSDQGHVHQFAAGYMDAGDPLPGRSPYSSTTTVMSTYSTASAYSGVSILGASANVSVNTASTNLSITASGGTETRVPNSAKLPIIKY